jgi:hypothetical protein
MATRFDLDMALASQLPLQQETNTNDELTRYLGSSPTKPCSPCVFWKENEHNSFLYRPARGALLPLEPPVQFPEAATVPPGAEWSVTGICIS